MPPACGFTLVEMMMVVVMVGALSVVALPRLTVLAHHDESAYRQVLRSSLSFARRTAQSQRRTVWVVRDPATHTLSFHYARVSDLAAGPFPGASGTGRLVVAHPGVRCTAEFPHQLCLPPSLTLSGPTEVAFGPLGQALVWGDPQFQVLNAGQVVGSVTVVPETGHVH